MNQQTLRKTTGECKGSDNFSDKSNTAASTPTATLNNQAAQLGQNPVWGYRSRHSPMEAGNELGNLALGRLREAGVQAKLEVGSVDHPLEHEADQFATSALSSEPPCDCGGSCPRCQDGQRVLRRKPLNNLQGASSTTPRSLGNMGSGQPISSADRGFFEPRLGLPLDSVRVHTGGRADRAARALGAAAFTYGDDIVFGSGRYRPNTQAGKSLLAHELAHVAQQRNGDTSAVQRHVDGDVRNMSITADWADALTDEELVEQIGIVRSQITASEDDPTTRDSATANLRILEREQLNRRAGPMGLEVTNDAPQVPRPAGLPLDSGYSLSPAPVSPDIANSLPEGELLTAQDLNRASGVTSSGSGGSGISWIPVSPVMQGAQLSGTGSGAALLNSSRALASSGFAAAGENAIGLVMFPQVRTAGHMLLESRLSWGHTAMYTRVGGRITVLRSYAPSSLMETVATGMDAVKTGNRGVPASIYHGGYTPGEGIPMWTHSGARSIEYPVTRAIAEGAAEGLPDIGPVSGGRLNGLYTGVGATENLAQGANCVVWAVPEAEAALGGGIGPLTAEGTATSASALGPGRAAGTGVNVGSQGRVYGMLGEMMPGPGETAQTLIGFDNRSGARVMATVISDAEGNVVRTAVNALPEAATGAAVVGEMSRGMRYLRWGGRVFFVIGLLTIPAEVALAREGTRTRTAVGAVSGFAGGMAAGAALGLMCGPGALVCSVVTGLIGGIVGGFVARNSAEAIYDAATTQPQGRPMSAAESARFSADLERYGTVCPNCHQSPAPATGPAFDSPYSMSAGGVLMPGPRQVTLSDDELALIRSWLESSPER